MTTETADFWIGIAFLLLAALAFALAPIAAESAKAWARFAYRPASNSKPPAIRNWAACNIRWTDASSIWAFRFMAVLLGALGLWGILKAPPR